MENICQVVEAFDIQDINFVFLWNEEQELYEEAIKENSYILDKNMNVDALDQFILCRESTVLLSTESIDELIDTLINMIRNSSDMEVDFLQKLCEGKSVMEFESSSNEILLLFITEGCTICEQVKEQMLYDNELLNQFSKIIYVADYNSDEYFSDSFIIYSRYFSIDEFPTILVYDEASQKYQVNPEEIIEQLQ